MTMASRDAVETSSPRENLDSRPAEVVLAWALTEFHPRIALASSFGAEDMVLIDMLACLEPGARVFTLDTGRLPAARPGVGAVLAAWARG
jgi:phosphoadenosine phosphosulfate reductase